jgi:hypothetical protein
MEMLNQPSATTTAFHTWIADTMTGNLTIEHNVLCAGCALVEEIIRVREDLAVEVKRDRLLVRRDGAEVEVSPGEIRHLVNALAEADARLLDLIAQEGQHSR